MKQKKMMKRTQKMTTMKRKRDTKSQFSVKCAQMPHYRIQCCVQQNMSVTLHEKLLPPHNPGSFATVVGIFVAGLT